MKSHSHQNSLKPSEQEIFAEADSLGGSPMPEAKLPAPVRTPASLDAMFLMFLGCGSLVLGLALCLGPKLSWKLNQIADGFKYLGVQGGVLVMGGLILFALGLLRRGQVVLRTPTTEQVEDRQLIEQLTKDSLRITEDLGRLESGLDHVESELVRSRRALEERLAMSERTIISAFPQPKEGPSQEDAIFRLAASLDQVGARIDQRLKTQYTALQDHLEDVGAAILSARNQMQGLQHVGNSNANALREEVQAQVESALEETGFFANGRRANAVPSLGVLDTLHDDPAIQSFTNVEAINAALPQAAQAQPELSMEQLDQNFGSAELDTKTRLIQLSSLLADPKLRQALEGLRGPQA